MSSRNATYVIGHKSLDADHEVIIALWRTLETTKTMEAARMAASQLMDETLNHFTREEAFMRQCGFPGLDGHRAIHQELASSLRHVILAPTFDTGKRADFIGAVCALMGRMVTHIVVEDAKIAPYARNLASQVSRAMAKTG